MEMKRAGLTNVEIARALKVSRQRVTQVVQHELSKSKKV